MIPSRLYKKEKLCSAVAIEQLFSHGVSSQTTLAFPLRCVWRENSRRSSDAPIQFLISIPKKRIRHAVDRVTMRRRVREAFRINRSAYPLPDGLRIDMALIYVDTQKRPYGAVEHAMQRILSSISGKYPKSPSYGPTDPAFSDQ